MEKTIFKRTFEADFETINSVGAIHWIGNDEVLLIFRGFAAILRIDPFCEVIDLKFPYDISHIEFKSHCKPSIVPFIARSLNLQFFDPSMYRSRCKPENWHICNEIFMDSILITQQKYDDRAPIRISNFACQTNELMIFVAHDGQPLLYGKFGVKFQFKENLTDKIVEYFKVDSHLLKNLLSKLISDEKYLNEAWNILSVAKFVAVQSWHFARFKNQIVGFSIQKDDSIIVWRWKNGDLTISNVYQFFENEKISCLHVYIDRSTSSNFLIFGSGKGNLYVAKIVIEETKSIAIENPRLIKSFDDNCRIFHVIVKEMNGCRKLIASRNASFFFADFSIIDGNILLSNQKSVDSISRFPCTNLIANRESIVGFCSDNSLRINADMSMSNIQSIFGTKKRQTGLDMSENRNLLLHCAQRECIDRQYCRQPNELAVVFGTLNRIWREIMIKDCQNAMMGSFDNSLDYLLCIRQAILNVDLDIPLYIAEFIDTLRNPETVNLYHLKVGRFILWHMKTRMFHCNASKEESNKIETLLIGVEKMLVKYRAGILMNSCCSAVVVDQAKQIFDAVSNGNTPLNLNQPCPFCGTKNLISSAKHSIEFLCENNHAIPLCCRSLLIIDDFSYDKCSRCGLPSKKNCPVEDLKSEVFRRCSMCDGMIAPSDL